MAGSKMANDSLLQTSTVEIVKLTTVLPTEQVMLNIQAALTGEYESMKKYGVILSATIVQERAHVSWRRLRLSILVPGGWAARFWAEARDQGGG